MKLRFLLPFLLVMSSEVFSQTFTNSNLPIVIIATDNNVWGQPREIPDEPKIPATMKVIYRPTGERNYVTDQNIPAYLNYKGRIAIETKGSTSQSLDKKPYSLTTMKVDDVTTNNVSILGMPSENDWVLNALAFDASLIRDYLSYDLSTALGNYAARGRYCEVIVNGDYKGLYVFMEKIKIDQNRVDIAKMNTTDISGVNLTGGYLIKSDKTTGGDPVAWSMESYNGYTDFIYDNPKPSEITNEQGSYIYNQFEALRTDAATQNSSIQDGFPADIDIPSFVDFMLINELGSNADAYQFSTYFHKDKKGKLRAGPVWDFNLTYGNDLWFWGLDRSFTDVWQFDNGDNTGAKFWRDLYDTPTFKCYLAKRWNEQVAAGKPLSYSEIATRIDAAVALISEAAVREEARWGTVGNHAASISDMKSWIQDRITWMNTQLNDYSACASVSVPSLVISKIHYNPRTVGNLTGDALEFIEITNNGTATVDLSGVYFKELGLSYQFPYGASIESNATIALAGDTASYRLYYGKKAFDQYARNLSNGDENLVLADAFGNTIDEVHYRDQAPWPTAADGLGSCLKLADLNSDNSLGASWVSENLVTATTPGMGEIHCALYPNPTQHSLTITTINPFISCEVTDFTGRVVLSKESIRATTSTMDIGFLVPSTYYVKIIFEDGNSVVKKISKQ